MADPLTPEKRAEIISRLQEIVDSIEPNCEENMIAILALQIALQVLGADPTTTRKQNLEFAKKNVAEIYKLMEAIEAREKAKQQK